MPVHFKRLATGWPDDYQSPQDNENSWSIFTACTESTAVSCTTRADVKALAPADRMDARTTFVKFSLRAQIGLPLTEMYDEKQCHEAHAFKLHPHDSQSTKIWRIWGSGKIRTYFIYLPNRRLAILKTWAKRKDKLSGGELLELEALAKSVLHCLETHTFETLLIHD